MQVVHTLGAGQLHHFLGKDEDLRDFLMALNGAEGLKEVFVAAEELVRVSSVLGAYSEAKQRGLVRCTQHHSGRTETHTRFRIIARRRRGERAHGGRRTATLACLIHSQIRMRTRLITQESHIGLHVIWRKAGNERNGHFEVCETGQVVKKLPGVHRNVVSGHDADCHPLAKYHGLPFPANLAL